MLLFGVGNFNLAALIAASSKGAPDYPTEAAAAQDLMPPLGVGQKGIVVTVTDAVSGDITPYFKTGVGADKLAVLVTSK